MTLLETTLAAALPGPIKTWFMVDGTYRSPSGSYVAAIKVGRRKPSQDEQTFTGRHMKFSVFAADLTETPAKDGQIEIGTDTFKIVDVDAGAVMHRMTGVKI